MGFIGLLERSVVLRLPHLLLIMIAALMLPGAVHAAPRYMAYFDAQLQPQHGIAAASIRIEQKQHLLTQMMLRMPASRFSDIEADGQWERQGDRIVWQVPSAGGSLSYRYRIDNKRSNGAWDAQLNKSGALFRGDDLFPPATVSTNERARSKSWLSITAPTGWSVETQYGNTASGKVRFVNPQRRFDRPTGWMLAGPLGIRRETIAGRAVAAAAIRGEGLRRNDILAFLRWNLSELIKVTGRFPNRLLIVGADDPFWRGGLSGPKSLYMHSARPLIAEDGTSTLLHELFHVATGFTAAKGDDWIVEGLAEYYSLEVMRRTGTIGSKRFTSSLADLSKRGQEVARLRTSRSSGAITALAVSLFADLDAELRSEVPALKKRGLDAVVQELLAQDLPLLSLKALDAAVAELGLESSEVIDQMKRQRSK